MKKVIHRSEDRGSADHGWLKAKHSFSFASFFDPARMGFGLLRVINDDIIAPSKGFDTHPHRDMEIVTIPLSGALAHKDSEGHESVIRHGEVQLMSAGKGIYHSEFNASNSEEVNLLQIWVMPKELRIAPRYDQRFFTEEGRKNRWQTVVAPMERERTGMAEAVKINQESFFSLADLEGGRELEYRFHIGGAGRGAYLFVIDGEVEVDGERLRRRDAMGIAESQELTIKSSRESQLLLIEVPLQ